MNSKRSVVAALALLTSACTGLPERIGTNIGRADSEATSLVHGVGRLAEAGIAKPDAAVLEDGIWIGKHVVPLSKAALPPIFFQPATFDRSVNSLQELAERITQRSGIPAAVSPDAIAVANGTSAPPSRTATATEAVPRVPPATASPARGRNESQGNPIRITYINGTFKGFLDTVAARFGVSWKYVNGTIQFFHTEARTFQISAVPGDSSFSATVTSGATSTGGAGGSTGGGGGSAGGTTGGISSNNSQNTSVASKLSVYAGIESAISAMLSPSGKVVASPATGTITVVDTPDVLGQVAAFLEKENAALSRQVVINVTVLSVTLSDGDEYGINWSLVYSGLRNRYGIQNSFGSATAGSAFSAGILNTANSSLAGSSLIIKALSEQGKVRRYTTASVVTLNNQPVPVQVARQTSYLQSSQTTTTALVGSSTTLIPGTITSGFNMSILPHVLDNGKLMLQFSTDISALRGIRTVTSNGSSIETPEVDTRNFLQRIAMRSNETLVISGFEQIDENLDRQGVGQPTNYLLGGGYKAGTNKESIVILITPTTMAGS